LRAILGQEAQDEAVSFATDAGWLQRLDFDCVLWGPGSIRVAHKPNEYVPIADLEAAAATLGALIERCCVVPEPGA
jgi:acetylornithine deacetylase